MKRKTIACIHKLNCFDYAKENDGAVKGFGQREPRSLDESRHSDIAVTMIGNDPEMPDPDHQVISVRDSRKANNANLARMLNFHRDVTLDDDVMSGGSGDDAGSYDIATGIRWRSHRRTRNFSTQSLDGKGTIGGDVMKDTPKESTRRSSTNDTRKNLRNSSLRRTIHRISNRRSMTRAMWAKDVDDSVDASEQTKATLLDSSDMDESSEFKPLSNSYPSNEIENEQVKKATDNEGQWVANFDQPKNTAQTTTPLSTTIAPVCPDRRTSLPTLHASGNRTIRRTLSTSALEPLTRSILKIGDSVGASHPQPRGENSVRFDRVEMREFDRTVGDNPSVSSGVPIGLDWNYNPNPLVKDLEDYETDRAPRRSKRELALGPSAREDMLLRDWGLTFRELNKTTIETDSIRKQRYKSAVQNPMLQKRDEILETTKRRVSRVFTGGKKREQEKLWEEAQKPMHDLKGDPYDFDYP